MKYVNYMNGAWYCRIRPKAHLRPFLPIKTLEYNKKLNATTASEAESLAIPIINKWKYEIIERPPPKGQVRGSNPLRDAN